MSERGSFDHTLFGIALATVVVIGIIVIWVALGGEGPQTVANDYEASQYKESATSRIEATCAGLEGARFAECSINIEQSERENHRAQKDLRAQRYMAIWAFVMAGAAIGTLGVTAVGLTMIKATLDETKRAVKAADDAVNVSEKIGLKQIKLARNEYRIGFKPWITVDLQGPFDVNGVASDSGEYRRPGGAPMGLYGSLMVSNIGTMPATMFGYRIWVEDEGDWSYISQKGGARKG